MTAYFQRAGIEYIHSSAGKQVRIAVKARCAWCVLRIEYIRLAISIIFVAVLIFGQIAGCVIR